MLVIRKQQQQVFREQARQRFVDRAVVHVTRLFPEQTVDADADQLRGRISESLDRAAGFGITATQQALLFVDLEFGLGPRFWQQPEHAWTEQKLTDEGLDQEEKMVRIFALLQVKLGVAG